MYSTTAFIQDVDVRTSTNIYILKHIGDIMKSLDSIQPYIYWLWLVGWACGLGGLAAVAGFKGSLRHRLKNTIMSTISYFCIAITFLALLYSKWSVESWDHGILSFNIATQLHLAGLALVLFIIGVVAICGTAFFDKYVVLSARLPRTFRKTRLIRKRNKHSNLTADVSIPE